MPVKVCVRKVRDFETLTFQYITERTLQFCELYRMQ